MTKPNDDQMTPDRWKLALQMSGLGVWDYTIDETKRFFSDEWFSLRGADLKSDFDMVQRHDAWLDRLHPNDRVRVRDETRKFHAGEISAINLEFRELHKDGHYVWILSRGQAVEWLPDGAPCRFLGTDTDITSIKSAETAHVALREEQMRFRIAVENANLGVWDNNLVTGESYKSKGWKTMRGHSADSAYGSEGFRLKNDLHPDDVQKLERQKENYLLGRIDGTISTQYRQRRKDGSWMWVLSRGNIVSHDSAGRPLRAIGVDTDITEIKAQEATLASVSKTLKLAVSASQMGVWESFTKSGDAIWDNRTREIFGLCTEAAEIPPDVFKSFIHKDDVPIVEAECDAPAARGEGFSSQFRIVHPENGVRHVKVEATFHLKHALGPRHVGIIFDVTDLVERESALNKSNTQLDDVLQHMEQGIAMFHGPTLQSSKIVLSNEKFYELLELKPSASALSFTEYCDHINPLLQWPQNGFHSLDEIVHAAAEGVGLNTLLRLPSSKVISVTGIGHGKNSRIVTITDMTDLFESEHIREELATNLSHLERLQSLGQLTGGVAHDFNNLLTVVIGNAELVREGHHDQGECLNAILEAANRGAELTQRLLAFSRKQPLQPTSIATGELLSNLKELLARTLGDTIEFETAFKPDVWSVHADRGQLENALINLAVNARDAMPNGGALKISVENEVIKIKDAYRFDGLTAGEYVKFKVVDQGVGMDSDTLKRAFDPFFTTKDIGQGSGLGLSMVFGFIKQSEGDVTISSQEGSGTLVEFLLPRGVANETQKLSSLTDVAAVGQGQTILLVEDDANVRGMIEIALERLNYQVVSFGDAIQATAALSNKELKPQLIISDVSLPGGMSGFDFGEQCELLRPECKILFISGYNEQLFPSTRLNLEKMEFLQKPFTVHALGTHISTILNNTQ